MALKLLLVLLPWPLRRLLLQRLFGYYLHPNSRVGMACVFRAHLTDRATAFISSR
jgi:hypothetical protein